MPLRTFLLHTAAGLLLAGVAAAGNWPEFRGPTGQGLADEPGLPVEWGPGKNVAWKQTIPGLGWSSPVVQGGQVYLTTATPVSGSAAGDHSLRALCLDAATGKTVWDNEVFRQDGTRAPRIHGKNSHASPTPLLHDGRLYAHFGHQGTACLDLAGKVLWRNNNLPYDPVHGNGGSPILVGDALIFSADASDQAFVAALDRKTGNVLWKTPRSWEGSPRFSFSTPLLIHVGGKPQVVSAGSDGAAAYDPATGKEVWRVRYHGYSVIPRPVFGHGLVYLSTGYNSPSMLAVRPDGAGDVTATHIAWTQRQGAPHTPSPLLAGDELYLVSDRAGVATCLDAKTGRQLWQQRLGGNYSASPLYAGGRVYFQSEEGVGTVVKAGRTYELLARNALNERTLASAAAADGALFLRTEHHLYRFQAR